VWGCFGRSTPDGYIWLRSNSALDPGAFEKLIEPNPKSSGTKSKPGSQLKNELSTIGLSKGFSLIPSISTKPSCGRFSASAEVGFGRLDRDKAASCGTAADWG
jgi:hypothetical protein